MAKQVKQAAETETTEKVIDKAVYLRPDDTLKAVIANGENVAGQTLRFVGSMTVHLIVNAYNPIEAERVMAEDSKRQVYEALREHGAAKRGKDFGRAWCYRLLSLAVNTGRTFIKDYKSSMEGSPLQAVLRARTVDKAIDLICDHMTTLTKGENNLQALERSLDPKSVPGFRKKPSRVGQRAGAVSNNRQTQAEEIREAGKQLAGKEADAVATYAAIPAKSAAQRAETVVNRALGAPNVDRVTFVMKALAFITDPNDLMKIADKATELAKKIHAKADKGANETKETKAAVG